jgi:hypothetical protein
MSLHGSIGFAYNIVIFERYLDLTVNLTRYTIT